MANGHFPLQDTLRRPQRPESLAPTEQTIQRFLAHCHRRRYASRTDVFRPGDPATTMYYVISGSLSVISEEEDGRELVLTYINPGEFVGETGVFISAPQRDVVLRTRTACELAEISYERLHALFGGLREECPRLLFAIGSQLTRRLLHTGRKASRLAFMDVSNRIANTILDLCHEPDAMSHPEGTQIRVSRQELARIVGCSREMAGRVLKQLEERGMLRARGKTIVVLMDRLPAA
ncbi:MAG TPA: cAMP-activated global transcriptional regulator CRP [Chiayiivirga sp.]|nr:cAMP-activated global transcriptional regulator CRP [Chiayiivirga sp.]HRQ35191.1 cAMP-activated global transcriptional regulator CRP [Chiayiivirga sp.]